MKKWIALMGILLLVLSGCAAREAEPTVPTTEPVQTTATTAPTEPSKPKTREDTRLMILLPDAEAMDWAAAGEDLQMLLQNLHYQTELVYARADAAEQAQLMQYALEQGVDGLILAPVESAALTEVCQLALDQQIPIFAYDRLLMDTDAVNYYVSFDYIAMGAALAQHIVTEKGLDTLTEGSITIEFFMGSPEDSNALLLYQGIMSVLQPYLDQGTLVSLSGRTAFEDTCVLDWDPLTVSANLEEYLKEYYKGKIPDVICTVSDDFVSACTGVLQQRNAQQMPLITGLGGTETGRQNIAEGKQSISISTDLLQLNDRLVQTVDDVMTGKEPEVNDTENCFNNVKAVPAYLCSFEILTGEPEPTEPQ